MASDINAIDYFPPSGFYFEVQFDGALKPQGRFQEVSGMEAEVVLERIKQAGQNLHDYPVPGRTKFNNLIFKRGLVTEGSELAEMVKTTFMEETTYPITTHNIIVTLKDPGDGSSLMSWNFVNAYPVKWGVSGFKSQDSAIVIESIEFAYFSWNFKSL